MSSTKFSTMPHPMALFRDAIYDYFLAMSDREFTSVLETQYDDRGRIPSYYEYLKYPAERADAIRRHRNDTHQTYIKSVIDNIGNQLFTGTIPEQIRIIGPSDLSDEFLSYIHRRQSRIQEYPESQDSYNDWTTSLIVRAAENLTDYSIANAILACELSSQGDRYDLVYVKESVKVNQWYARRMISARDEFDVDANEWQKFLRELDHVQEILKRSTVAEDCELANRLYRRLTALQRKRDPKWVAVSVTELKHNVMKSFTKKVMIVRHRLAASSCEVDQELTKSLTALINRLSSPGNVAGVWHRISWFVQTSPEAMPELQRQ